MNKTAIIVGAGPAGLTAAEQLINKTNIKPIIIECDTQVGGISKTVVHNGNRMDLGGHRFFSKSDRVMQWWLSKMLTQYSDDGVETNSPETKSNVLLQRERLSRIYYRRKFFNYPINLSIDTVRNLGLARCISIGMSYMWIKAFPIRKEENLEDFFTNRFGKKLYQTFFRDYTEKVWGVPCNKISPDWGGQRVKGLSISAAIKHALKQATSSKKDIEQKEIETSLIERFLYPKLGPGQMWENIADEVCQKGGELHYQHKVIEILHTDDIVTGVKIQNIVTNEIKELEADYVFSSMPINELIAGMKANEDVQKVSEGLVYRDFITVGLMCNKLLINKDDDRVKDNWIYIQENDVMLGRLQIFNNWSPYLVTDSSKYWMGLEYFCFENDDFWNKSEEDLKSQAIKELEKIKIIDSADVIDSTVYKVKKAYPAYFGTYKQLDKIVDYTNNFDNLFLIGRNGMHKYNNQDHSMLTAMTAVDNIIAGRTDKSNIWEVNTESDYHETKEKNDK